MFTVANVTLWLGNADTVSSAAPPEEMKWIFLIVWIVGSTAIWVMYARIKYIEIDATDLYISNYRRKISVPFSDIESVSENFWVNPRTVTIEFRNTTEFGKSVRFIPPTRIFAFWSPHPVVAELRDLAGNPPARREPPPGLAPWFEKFSFISKLRDMLANAYAAPPNRFLIANLVIALFVGLSNGLAALFAKNNVGLTGAMKEFILTLLLPGCAIVLVTGLIGLVVNALKATVLGIHAIVIAAGSIALCWWILGLVLGGLPPGGFSWTPGMFEAMVGYAAFLVCRFVLSDRMRTRPEIFYLPIVVVLTAIPLDIGVLIRFVEKMQTMMSAAG